MTRRLARSFISALALCVLGAGLVLLAAGQPWASATVADLPGRPVIRPTGGTLAPAASGLGLVALAGVLAIVATRGVGRIIVGGLLVLAGLGIIAAPLQVGGDVQAALQEPAIQAAGHTSPSVSDQRLTAWPVLAGFGGLLVTASGALTVIRGRRWPGMSPRYERTVPDRRGHAGETGSGTHDRSLWDAIGRGDDPTA